MVPTKYMTVTKTEESSGLGEFLKPSFNNKTIKKFQERCKLSSVLFHMFKWHENVHFLISSL